jgi:hypothetical protein
MKDSVDSLLEPSKFVAHPSAKKNQWVVHVVLVSVQVCFSGWHIVGSMALKKGADALAFALYREIFATILMFALVKQRGRTVNIENKVLISNFHQHH